MGRFLNRRHLARTILVTSLALGLLGGAAAYVVTSISVPAPARTASLPEMQARGAEVYVTFCTVPKFEPRFWPECKNDVEDWRARGAERLVAFCTHGVPSRMFGAEDCMSPDRGPMALTRPPNWRDAAIGAGMAAAALVVLGLLAAATGGTRTRRSPSPG